MDLTYQEIKEQYFSMEQTKTYLDECIPQISHWLKSNEYSSLIVLGCGSSYSLAKSFAQITNMRTGFPATALPAGDVLLHIPRYVKCFTNSLVLAISRSGSTSEILLAIKTLKEQGCPFTVAALTCRDGSELSKLADISVNLPWAYDNSVCQTRTVSCLYYTFSYTMANLIGDSELLADLDLVLSGGGGYIEKIDGLLRDFAGGAWSNVVVLGDAELCGLAEEGALAFKEICQLPSNYYHLLDTRHGPAVLIDKNTLILAVLGEANSYDEDFLREMSNKTPHVVAFTDLPRTVSGVLMLSYEKELGHIAKGLPFILICQLLSYHKAIRCGADPDAPAGLAPWISL